jgi:putative aminopeptidase FrvX
MRRAGIGQALVEEIVAASDSSWMDPDGNLVVVGRDGDGRPIEVVIALDDPGFVITVIPRRKIR